MSKIRGRESDELQCMQRGVGWVRHFLEHWYELDVSKHSPVRQKSAVLLHVSDSSAQQYCGLCANILFAD
jgi:hypothetical protein